MERAKSIERRITDGTSRRGDANPQPQRTAPNVDALDEEPGMGLTQMIEEYRDGTLGWPSLNLAHLIAMTDDIGMYQHAIYDIPNYREGYTTDDNARAAMLAIDLESEGEIAAGVTFQRLASRYLAFLAYAFEAASGRFRNVLGFDRRWQETVGSEDSHGRAMQALGMCYGKTIIEDRRLFAERLFREAIPAVLQFTSPRAWAFSILGVVEFCSQDPMDAHIRGIGELLALQLLHCYQRVATDEWRWFEDRLSYANTVLPEALIAAGAWMERPNLVAAGIESLNWMVALQHAPSGRFSPIGSEGFYVRQGERAHWDQQPLEAWSTISACQTAFRVTGDDRWYREARTAFEWFVGVNDLGLSLCDPVGGGCYDGLHVARVNRNQGAESSLALALSLSTMRKWRG